MRAFKKLNFHDIKVFLFKKITMIAGKFFKLKQNIKINLNHNILDLSSSALLLRISLKQHINLNNNISSK